MVKGWHDRGLVGDEWRPLDDTDMDGMAFAPCPTAPGDVVFFHHSLFHAAYGKFPTRRYIAIKFVTPPDSDAKLRSMLKYAAGAFDVDPALLERPRLRPLVEALPGLGEQARALA